MFLQPTQFTRILCMLGIIVSLCACKATGQKTSNGQTSDNTSAVTKQTGLHEAPVLPEPGLTPRQRILKAIQQLETGKAEVAKVELNEYLVSTPDSNRAKHLLKQITTPANQFYPAEFFTVDLAFGQSLSTLTQHYLGSALEFYALAKYNGIENPSRVNTGSKIKIPLTAHARSVREKDSQTALNKAQQNESVVEDAKDTVPTSEVDDIAVPAIQEVVPETPEILQTRLAEANQAGDYAQSLILLESLQAQDAEFDGDLRLLAVEALLGRAESLKVTAPSSASPLYAQAAAYVLQNGDEVTAFDYYKQAFDVDDANTAAQQKMTQLQQQIVDQYHREASIAFRQQRIEEAIKKWDVVLHVDPSNTNVSAYRTQAVELRERLKAINN